MNTGGTFGDNSTPSNFAVIAWARCQDAQQRWRQVDTIERAIPYLPPVELAPPPSAEEIAEFCPAEQDTLNSGVLDASGNRLPPQYDHHVDENLYADVQQYMRLAVSASVLALYDVLGFPSVDVPDPMSQEKFKTKYDHLQKTVGYHINTRRLVDGILP
jgi:hypothetical protein